MNALTATRAPVDADPDNAPTPFSEEAVGLCTALECLAIVGRRHHKSLVPADLARDNDLSLDEEPSPERLARCAERSGMRTSVTKLDWRALSKGRKALPAIVRLLSGAYMVLIAIEGDDAQPVATLIDPCAGEAVELTLDRLRFEQAWTGEVLLLRRCTGWFHQIASNRPQPA